MSRNQGQRTLWPAPRYSVQYSSSAAASRPQASGMTSRPEAFLPQLVSRRQSKGGLRDMFSKNRSTRTLVAKSERDEASPDTRTSILSTGSPDVSWTPPPLFQAYPQSVRHVNLEASTISADSILRMNEQRNTSTVHDSEPTAGGISANSTLTAKRGRISASVAKAEWTRKLYVLTTSGHLLQYSGEGAFDRKPEKVLQLGKDSAAFASDAIEGRHFVLHVSQSCSDDGEPDLDSSKGIFSRIGIKTSGRRRSARVLLMVFDTPDDLDSWLSAIRKMIGRVGGRPYSPEHFVTDPKPPVQPEISRRYLVRKDPHRFSQWVSPIQSMDTSTEGRPSTQSSTYTATDLERLRDSKTSNTSFVTGTATSLLDSPPSSPAQEKFALAEVPHLELPDLGPSSLVDFSQQGRRQSRLSLMGTDITRHKSVEVKPTARCSRQGSFRARPVVRKNSSMPEMEQGQEGCQEKTRDQEQEPPPDVHDAQTSERPISTIAPLPTSFSLRHTAPELPSTHGYSCLFSATSETSGQQLPKRYSSLDYSRSLMQSHLPSINLSAPASLEKGLRRPTSMQLRTEPMCRVQMPARSPSFRSLGQESTNPAEATANLDCGTRLPTRRCQTSVKVPFGPPASPPPSCPLPAVPADTQVRRQSFAAKESIPPGSLGEAPESF